MLKRKILILSIIFYITVGLNSLFSENKNNYYLEVLKYGTDSDIIDTFKNVTKPLGEEIDKQVIKIFNEEHSLRVFNVLLNYIRISKIKDAKSLLLKELERKKANSDYLENVIYTIGALNVKTAESELLKIVKDKNKNYRIRIAAIDALGEIGDSRSSDLLIRIAEDIKENTDLRAHAILSLGKLKSKKAETIIKKILLNKYEKEILRMYAAKSIKEIDKRAAIEILPKLIKDKNYKVAEYATSSLAEINDPEVGEVLINALRSDYDGVRYYAAVGLGKLKYKKAVDILRFKSKFDKNIKVRKAAEEALKLINNKNSEFKNENNNTDIDTKNIEDQNKNRIEKSNRK